MRWAKDQHSIEDPARHGDAAVAHLSQQLPPQLNQRLRGRLEMPFLIAPLNQDGKLVGYAYISSKIVAASLSAAVSVREKTPFLQDAFVRDVNAVNLHAGSRSRTAVHTDRTVSPDFGRVNGFAIPDLHARLKRGEVEEVAPVERQ